LNGGLPREFSKKNVNAFALLQSEVRKVIEIKIRKQLAPAIEALVNIEHSFPGKAELLQGSSRLR